MVRRFYGLTHVIGSAEQTEREAFLMELDSPYSDLIVDRYQRFTSKKAVLEQTGGSPILVGAREQSMR